MSETVRILEIPLEIPSKIEPNTRIQKDDCIYCFDTADNNPSGLDICLKCYQSFSRGALNHTKEHYETCGHWIFLNIIKVLRPDYERNQYVDEKGERKQKIAKIQVRDLTEEETYDLSYLVYDIRHQKSYILEQLSPEFHNLVSDILSANSAGRQDEIKAWEQEVLPCEHSVEFEQVPNESLDLSKCLMCELKENLWICLHCGAIGCGREQFGSSLKGNSHALKHYELSGHSIAIKLGSLSAVDEDSYDAYCYKCNDEIKVFDVVNKLSSFGIDLQKAKKTEKSLVELNLDQNLSWDFKLDGQNGEKLEPIFGPGLTGFQNLGNSCYINSVLQALFSLDNYKAYFQNEKFSHDVDPTKDLRSQLIKIFDGLLSGRYSFPASSDDDGYQIGLKPSTFKTLIGENHPEFKTLRQQDAYEFLLYFLDKVDNELGISLDKDFNFLFGNKVVCSSCSAAKLKDELIDNLSLPIEEKVIAVDEETGRKIYEQTNLKTSFESYCGPETIEGYKCDHCNAKSTTAVRSTGFSTYPKYLIVNINRIKLENWVPTKVDVPIDIPYELDLRNFAAPKIKDDEIKVSENRDDNRDDFTPNEESFTMLLSMGFPEEKCIAGLKNTGNGNAEDAMNWILAHLDDIDEDAVNASADSSNKPTDDPIANLTSMGFSELLAKKALTLFNDPNAAVEWLFENPDDDGVIPETISRVDLRSEKEQLVKALLQSPQQNSKYAIKAVICHKGSSPHTGHYVLFIREDAKNKTSWVLFNDEKVVLCDESNLEDIRNNAYIYIFEQKE
ncbi:uncharacterized protein PRCAT00001005001 [Priceomyces carsonii]|uniref:uncharacterized protein n=1 Tax=Priceomyces carsonii TaxID=28549 RepID=UPI002ED7D495|nr:unnamed protein product [Priceomyces carsonii]